MLQWIIEEDDDIESTRKHIADTILNLNFAATYNTSLVYIFDVLRYLTLGIHLCHVRSGHTF